MVATKETSTQSALEHAPGGFCAVALFNPTSDSDVTQTVKQLIAFAESPADVRPRNLFILVAIGPKVAATLKDLPIEITPENWQADQAGLLVQVAAQTHAARLYALRTVHAIVANSFELKHELMGERILDGLEPFGFRDQDPSEAGRTRQQQAIDALGPSPWLLCSVFDQDIQKFFAPTGKEPEPVPTAVRVSRIGVPPGLIHEASVAQQAAAATAHVEDRSSHKRNMQAYAASMVRRGFPYRRDGQEGLVFVAAAPNAALLIDAAAHFNAGDPLYEFTRPRALGLYYCPPVSYAGDVPSPEPPPSAKALRPIEDLHAYEVTESYLDYFFSLMEKKVWPGEPGSMKLPEEVRALLRIAHTLLAGGDADSKQALDKKLDALEAASNRVNAQGERYITKG